MNSEAVTPHPPVLILAPLGADAAALRQQVEACGLAARVCDGAADFAAWLDEHGPQAALFVIVSHEGAGEETGAALARAFAAEPEWGRLPVVFLLADVRRPPPGYRMLQRDERAPYITVIERPARPTVLRHLFQALAEARRRQFKTQGLLARLQRAEQRQAFLLSELRHRTSNNLAVLQALFSLSSRHAQSLEELVASFTPRLRNLAEAHRRLAYAGGEACDLDELVREHVAPFAPSPDQLRANGPPIRIRAKVAFDVAMVLHELGTNAAKYGALSAPEGRVEVYWGLDEVDGTLRLLWRERGGPPVEPPSRQGLGSRLIEGALADGAAPEVRFEREGLVWRATLNTASFELVGMPASG